MSATKHKEWAAFISYWYFANKSPANPQPTPSKCLSQFWKDRDAFLRNFTASGWPVAAVGCRQQKYGDRHRNTTADHAYYRQYVINVTVRVHNDYCIITVNVSN